MSNHSNSSTIQVFELDTLGTRLQIRIDSLHACEGVFSEIKSMLFAFDQKYSRFIPGNWLDEFNRNGGGLLDEDGYAMLEFALELAQRTGGIFDPVIGARLTQLGYGSRETVMYERKQGSYRDIHVKGNHVELHHGVCLEFGGVGKGYALDKIVKILQKYDRFLVDFGGDIYGKWWWEVGLEDPEDFSKVIGKVTLQDGFFCSSAGSRRRFGNSHHLLNALTGNSTHHALATYVESQSGMYADGFATACFITPLELSLELFCLPKIEGVVLTENRTLYQSDRSNIELF